MPVLADGAAPYWAAFVALDRQRQQTIAPTGAMVPQPLSMSDVLAYGHAVGLCDTLDELEDYLTLVGRLDDAMLTHKLAMVRAAATTEAGA